jgi:hypothetical protein
LSSPGLLILQEIFRTSELQDFLRVAVAFVAGDFTGILLDIGINHALQSQQHPRLIIFSFFLNVAQLKEVDFLKE